MKTEIVKIDPEHVELYKEEISRAAEIICRGGLVAFPTETVYGLGASALDKDAARKIYEAKGRPSDNPLIAHVSRKEAFRELCVVENEEWFSAVLDNFVPGPITLVLKKRDFIPMEVTAGLDTLAVRFPVHTVARALLDAAGVPIAAPSANTSGRPSPTKASHVIEDLSGKVDMILDAGECSVGVESTILHIAGNKPRLLRPGAVTLEMLERVLKEVECDKAVREKLGEGEVPLAPGMKYRHYAPKCPVIALRGSEENVISYMKKTAENPECALLVFEEDLEFVGEGERVLVLGKRDDHKTHARRLFDLLREFDKMNVSKVYTRLPDDSEIGLAVVNRLLKACGYTVADV